MKVLFISIILFFALIFETAFFSLPLVLITVLLLGVLYKEAWIFPVAFGMGILLDLLSFRTVGVSSIFFCVMLGFIYLYQRKFEIQTLPFIAAVSLVVSGFYLLVTTGVFSLWSICFSCILATGFFWGVSFFIQKNYRV